MKATGRAATFFIFIISAGLFTSCGKASQKFSGYPDRRGPLSPVRTNGTDASAGQAADQAATSASFRMTDANIAGIILPSVSTSTNFSIAAGGLNAN